MIAKKNRKEVNKEMSKQEMVYQIIKWEKLPKIMKKIMKLKRFFNIFNSIRCKLLQ